MKITARQPAPAVAVLELHGRLIAGEGTGELRRRVQRLLHRNFSAIVLNLEHLGRIDCGGLGELLGCHCEVRRHGGGLSVVAPDRAVRKIFELFELGAALKVCSDERRAIVSLNPPRARLEPRSKAHRPAWSPADSLLIGIL